jgi:hypothetical protein
LAGGVLSLQGSVWMQMITHSQYKSDCSDTRRRWHAAEVRDQGTVRLFQHVWSGKTTRGRQRRPRGSWYARISNDFVLVCSSSPSTLTCCCSSGHLASNTCTAACDRCG